MFKFKINLKLVKKKKKLRLLRACVVHVNVDLLPELAFGSGPCGALFDLRPRKIMAAHGNGCAQRRNAGSIPRSLLLLLVWSGGANACNAGYYSSGGTFYVCTAVRITR
jgi:hypothetical protein